MTVILSVFLRILFRKNMMYSSSEFIFCQAILVSFYLVSITQNKRGIFLSLFPVVQCSIKEGEFDAIIVCKVNFSHFCTHFNDFESVWKILSLLSAFLFNLLRKKFLVVLISETTYFL